MKITATKPTKRNNRVNIELDGEYAFTVYADTAVKYELFTDNDFDMSLKDEIIEYDSEKYAKRTAFDYLSRGACSVDGMKKKLGERGIDERFITDTIAYLTEHGYLDDIVYSENAVSLLHESKGYGKRRILELLHEKGVSRETAETVCDAYFSDAETPDVLSSLLDTLLSQTDMRDIKAKQRLISKLFRMGYSYSEINDRLRERKYDTDTEDFNG